MHWLLSEDRRRVGKTMTEQQPYELVQRYPHFEVRRYPAYVVAEVQVNTSFDRAGNAAFRDLFNYISGSNAGRQKLAMTAPVPQDVKIRDVPGSLAAAVRFSGSGTAAAFTRRNDGLQVALTLAGLVPVGTPRFARFDPPFKPWFLHRNEVVQDVAEPVASPGSPGV
jgi:hypothetical protein